MKKMRKARALLFCVLAAGTVSLTGCGIESIVGGGGGGGGGFGIGNIGGLISGLLKFVPQIGGGGKVLATGTDKGPAINIGGGDTTSTTTPPTAGLDPWPLNDPLTPETTTTSSSPTSVGDDPWPLDYPTSGAAGPGGGSWNEGEPEPMVQQPYEPEGDEV